MREALKESLLILLAASVLGFSFSAVTASGFFSGQAKLPPDKALKTASPAPSIISIADAKMLFNSGDALFVDARHEFDYKQGHIRGAVNIPLSQFDNDTVHLSNVPKTRPIVAYCDGVECNSSIDLAGKLYDRGYKNVRIFFGGWQEWISAGLPTER